jgi:cob(I)alamin adenosyltransferase
MSKFYTRGGDDGYTGLLGPGRIAKEDARLEAVGAVDEANALLGIARAQAHSPEYGEILLIIQRDLYGLMAELAATPENAERFRVINSERVAWLEQQVDALTKVVDVPKEFIVPGDTFEGAFLDLARAVVRRAERRAAAVFHSGDIANIELLRYLNRLSSFVFIYELHETRLAKQAGGKAEGKITLAKDGPG